MKISKNSWHYRLNCYNQPNFDWRMRDEIFTTCTYVRSTLFSLLLNIVKLLLISVAVAAAISVGFLLISPLIHLLGFFVPVEIWQVGLAILCTLIGMVIFAFLATGASLVGDKVSDKFKAYKHKQQSLLKATLQDKRDGICTIVEFE